MLKSCKYCGKIHESKIYCPERKRKYRPKSDREIDKFRSSYVWQKKRKRIKERDGYLCQVCLARGEITYAGIEVHHIEPLNKRFDLRLDDANLISLCEADHERAERGEISAAELKNIAQVRNAGVPPRV